MTAPMYQSALTWLDRGFELIPCYPNSKMQLTGYGLYSKHVTTEAETAKLWRDDPRRLNLAVVAPEGKFFVLDFDDINIYLMWVEQTGPVDYRIADAYREFTPGGGVHVFCAGEDPKFRLDEKTGVMKPIMQGGRKTFVEERRVLAETKRVVIVAPSVVKNIPYEACYAWNIFPGPIQNLFFPLSALLPAPEPPKKAQTAWVGSGTSKLEKIKANLKILDVVKVCFPKLKLRGERRFRSACCPFHLEKHPSFWIDTERNLFGCHGCNEHGDAINLYALSKNISNSEAIKTLILEWQL